MIVTHFTKDQLSCIKGKIKWLKKQARCAFSFCSQTDLRVSSISSCFHLEQTDT